MIRLTDITSQILSYHPKANIELVEKAYVYSAKAHQGQIRLSGEPYLSHPLEVAYILTKMKMDVTCIAAGFLIFVSFSSNWLTGCIICVPWVSSHRKSRG